MPSLIIGKNDITNAKPELAKKCNYSKNGTRKTSIVAIGSQKRCGVL